ncbi:MAG: type II 3-dehydroquinate dehydratase [Candidatus Marinimicrobia bacterium]|nr:type II 3-dehydroquinate dehydratase [Candidatus Neomarinimicrobiota bacterium]
MSDSPEINILVIHGPNMNLVGKRPREIFGNLTLDKINRSLRRKARELGASLKIFQSNSESDIVIKLQRQRNWSHGILLNPTTLCFNSYTIYDTLELIQLPIVEVHMTENLAGRSVTDSILTPVCTKRLVGPVDSVYENALTDLVKFVTP